MRRQNKQLIKHYADAAEMSNNHRMISKTHCKGNKTQQQKFVGELTYNSLKYL